MKRELPNQDLRDYAKDNDVALYEVADNLHISYSHIFYYLRKRLTSREKAEFMQAVEEAVYKHKYN